MSGKTICYLLFILIIAIIALGFLCDSLLLLILGSLVLLFGAARITYRQRLFLKGNLFWIWLLLLINIIIFIVGLFIIYYESNFVLNQSYVVSPLLCIVALIIAFKSLKNKLR